MFFSGQKGSTTRSVPKPSHVLALAPTTPDDLTAIVVSLEQTPMAESDRTASASSIDPEDLRPVRRSLDRRSAGALATPSSALRPAGQLATQIVGKCLKVERRLITWPEINTQNFLITVNAASNLLSTAANAYYGVVDVDTIARLSSSVVQTTASSIAQDATYRARIRAMQAAVEKLVMLTCPFIRESECMDGSNKPVKLEKPRLIRAHEKETDAQVIEREAAKIIAQMQRYGNIRIKTRIQGLEELMFVYSTMCSVETAITFGLSVLPLLILAAGQVGPAYGYILINKTVTSGLVQAASCVPFASGFDKIYEACAHNETKIAEDFLRVLRFAYIDRNRLYQLRSEDLKPFARYLGADTTADLTTAIEDDLRDPEAQRRKGDMGFKEIEDAPEDPAAPQRVTSKTSTSSKGSRCVIS